MKTSRSHDSINVHIFTFTRFSSKMLLNISISLIGIPSTRILELEDSGSRWKYRFRNYTIVIWCLSGFSSMWNMKALYAVPSNSETLHSGTCQYCIITKRSNLHHASSFFYCFLPCSLQRFSSPRQHHYNMSHERMNCLNLIHFRCANQYLSLNPEFDRLCLCLFHAQRPNQVV